MQTTTIARGSQYSEADIYDATRWGDIDPAQAEMIGDMITSEFTQLANERLPYAGLIVSTGEVYGDANAEYPEDVDEILAECLASAYEYATGRLDEFAQ